ncbi:MAG: flagellar hook-length control protein FliK, partial [Pirellulales bacterium]
QTEGDAESARSVSTAASDAPGSTTAGIADAPSETEDSANSSGHAGGTANPQVEKAGHVDVNGEADGESSDGETERTVDGTAPQLASGFTEEAGASEDGDGTPASETPRGEKGTESGDSASDRRTDRSRSTAGQSPRGTRSSDPANVRQMTANPTDSQGASPQATSLQGVTTLGENGSAGGTPDPPGGPSSAGSTRSAVQPVGTLLRSEATRMQAPVSGNAAPDTAAGNVDHVRFVQRVARALQMGRSQQGELQLRLSPPELGRLNLEVSIKQGVLTARLEAETDAARSLILDNLPALRDRLSEQNIRIERFHVDLMAPSSDGSQGQVDYRDARQGEQGQRPTGGERRVDREADPRPTAQRGIPDIDGNLNVIV